MSTKMERLKLCKQRRNHLMGKDDKSDSTNESEKLKMKDHADEIQRPKKKKLIQ